MSDHGEKKEKAVPNAANLLSRLVRDHLPLALLELGCIFHDLQRTKANWPHANDAYVFGGRLGLRRY